MTETMAVRTRRNVQRGTLHAIAILRAAPRRCRFRPPNPKKGDLEGAPPCFYEII